MTDETVRHLQAYHTDESSERQVTVEPTKPIPVVTDHIDEAMKPEAQREEELHVVVESRTDIGLVRQVNQDAVILFAPLFGVADGMGGHKGGEIASTECRDRLIAFLNGKQPDPGTLEIGVKVVNRRIHIHATEDETLSGMGTTLTCIWMGEKEVYIAHAGDSRCYLFREGELRQVTQDHSMVMEMVRAGIITPQQAKVHPMRNVITRAVGTDRGLSVDITTIPRQMGDIWLICSDGLHGQLSEDTIRKDLDLPLPEAADALLSAVMEAGAPDNVSFVLVRDRGAQV